MTRIKRDDRLAMVRDLVPGDVFYALGLGITNGYATCVWVLPCEVNALAGGCLVDGLDVGYITNGVLRSEKLRHAKEVLFPWGRLPTSEAGLATSC